MHVLTIDTEHEPGSVAVVEVDDRTPDRQRTALVLGTVDPGAPDARRRAEGLAVRAGWLRSGAWELVADADVVPVVAAFGGDGDPDGDER